ncbi:putative oxidoreductase YdhV [Thalassoglobus neptunius]|uniref:Putative oxidoreductase YdhV n=1 Tax=Thalassoglobus neptunius TaxID=1938619 RepID=A0A5C5XAC3_9PLAN|nr:aldehyde ferredoxin oxidoreductase family protein [Thalassoglobus neptunius]TWT58812.1 putative oxidoreductase YdhV [Thalassoglobus neptunius]
MKFGYHGRYLRIDLSTRESRAVEIDPKRLDRFLGGAGLGTALLLEETSGCYDALGPEAPLIFVFSPLVGSPLTTSAKFSIVAKSPLTHRINDSLSSSHFAIAGKRTGFDAICLVGACPGPTALVIRNDTVMFEDAQDLWGLSSEQASERFRRQVGSSFRVAAIGPAGENGVRYATISNEGRHAGRGGLGAVMGSKRLKALAVSGDQLTEFAAPKELIAYSKNLSERSFGEATAKYRELGTVSNLLTFNRLGTLPTRNFQESSFSDAEAIAPESLSATRTRSSCAACTIGCEHIFAPQKDRSSPVRMEYENLYALGPMCGINDPEVILEASSYCDAAGIDTVSAGVCIAFAMECSERGLIEADGLSFGDGKKLLVLLQAIVSRETDLGDLLSQGVRAASRKIGQGSEEFAIHVKGLEFPGYDPRSLQTMALGFAVGARGADHNKSGAYQADFSPGVDRLNPGNRAAQMAVETEDEASIMDSLILCKFLRGVFEDRMSSMATMLELVTGANFNSESLKERAAGIVTAKKLFNIRQGWTAAEDTLPDRFFNLPVRGTPSDGAILNREVLRNQIQAYYSLRKWSPSGVPTEDALKRHELNWAT